MLLNVGDTHKLLWFVVLPTLVVSLILYNTYISIPGYTSPDNAMQLVDKLPTCYGLDLLMNKEATYADAPAVHLCLGYLDRFNAR